MDKTFIYRLKESMAKRNLSQADLSKLTGIRTSSISDYLSGKYSPKQDKIAIIAKALSVNPGWLMGYDLKEKTHNVNTSFSTDIKYLLQNTSYCTYGGRKIEKNLLMKLIQAAVEAKEGDDD